MAKKATDEQVQLGPAPADSTFDESNELEDFLNGLGPSGVSDVSLYRVESTGKQRFVATGPLTQFSELYVQQTYGGGDYVARGRVNGKWYRSRAFSIADKPGLTDPVQSNHAEIERLKAEMEAQRLQMERDRQQREQRNHELFLEALRHSNGGAPPAPTTPPASIADLVTAVKAMKDMAAETGGTSPQEFLKQSLEIIQRINELKAGTPSANDAGAPVEWWQSAIAEIGRFAEKLVPYAPQILNAWTAKAESPGVSASIVAPPAPVTIPPPAILPLAIPPATLAATPPLPAPDPQPGETVPPAVPVSAIPPAEEFQTYKKQILQMVLPLALAQSSPELYAELAFDQMRKGDIGILKLFDELLGSPDFDHWFLALQQLETALSTQRDWFARFYESVRAEYAAQQEQEQHGTEGTM